MLTLFLVLLILVMAVLFRIGFAVTGAVLAVLFWMFIKIPVGFGILMFGAALCCTILLIPVGIPMIRFGVGLMVPGGAI